MAETINNTRRDVLKGAALVPAILSAGLVSEALAGPDREPTEQELKEYYVFLWCELDQLSVDFGVQTCDWRPFSDGGGYEAYDRDYGSERPSSRAKAILAMRKAQS